MSKFAWVTLTTNDTYSLGALVLAHSLKRAGTAHQLAVLVTPTVSEAMRNRLKDVYNVVQEVNVLDSQDAANLALLKRPELGVTFTKLHCWRLVQFEKCVFLDADTLVLKNCDELFEREELSAAPDVSWPDCFNSGVFVFTPNVETFNKITAYAIEHGSFDGGDQGLLNQYFSDWSTADIKKHLPFVYNVTAFASYCYLPAFKQFRDKIKILHFAGKLKPWLIQFNSETKTAATPNDYAHAQDLIQHWWTIFCDNVHESLSDNMAGLAGALAQLRIGVQRTPEQEHYENLMRRQCWESGQVDYSGADAFDNIWKKITQTLEQKPEKGAEADQTDNDNDSAPANDNPLGYNKLLTKAATELLDQANPKPTNAFGPSLATYQGSGLEKVSSSTAAINQLPTNAQKASESNVTAETSTKPQRVQSSTQTQSMSTQSTQPQHILMQQQPTPAPTRPSRQRSSQLLTSADIEDGKIEYDRATGASTQYRLIDGGYEMIITSPQPNGTVKTQVKTFWDPKPVSEEDQAKELANKKIIKQRLGKEIRIDSKTTMLTRAIEGGYEEVYTTINDDGTRSMRTKTFFDSVPAEINENTTTKVNKNKKNVLRKSSVDSTDSTESSSRRIVQKMQKNVTQSSNDSQSNYSENTTVEETRSVSQNIEITENNRTVRKNSLQEQSMKAITHSTNDGGKKKKKPKSSAPPPPADFVQNNTTTVASKRVPGGVEYVYSTELESGKTITTSKTVYEEEEVELTEEEIKQYKKTLKDAEKHKNVTSTKKLKSESGTKKVVPSENPGDVTTVETIKIEGGTEYHYTTVTSEGIVKKAVKTVFDPVPSSKSNPDDTDEEEIIEEYEEEIIEPGDKIIKTIETVKQLPQKFQEEVTITHEKKEKKVKKTMVISQ